MEVGTWVNVINEGGNVCATGQYLGMGIPAKSLNPQHPTLQHYAVQIEGQVRYYPTGFNSLVKK